MLSCSRKKALRLSAKRGSGVCPDFGRNTAKTLQHVENPYGYHEVPACVEKLLKEKPLSVPGGEKIQACLLKADEWRT